MDFLVEKSKIFFWEKCQKHGVFEKFRPEGGVLWLLINSNFGPRPGGGVFKIICFLAIPAGVGFTQFN